MTRDEIWDEDEAEEDDDAIWDDDDDDNDDDDMYEEEDDEEEEQTENPFDVVQPTAAAGTTITYATTGIPTGNATPQQVLSELQDEALLMEMLGDDAMLLEARLSAWNASKKIEEEEAKKPKKSRATKVSADKIVAKAAKVKASPYPKYDEYLQFMLDEMEAIKEMAEYLYPSCVDIQNDIKFSDAEKTAINSAYKGSINTFGGSVLSMLTGRKCFTIVIHFPEFEITNSKKHKHTIKNLYVFISISGLLRFIGSFEGIRTSKTYAEYTSNYGHSHMQRSSMASHLSNFCLGETDFAKLVGRLRTDPYDRLRLESFLIQLGDYLKWESLEGGPYSRMAEISALSSRNRFQAPNSGHLTGYYKEFLTKNPDIEINIEDNGYDLNIGVNRDMDLWQKINDSIPISTHKLPFNEATGKTYEAAPDESEFNMQATEINRTLIKQKTGLTFKGIPLGLQVEVSMQKGNEGNKKYMIHESVVDYIVNTLQLKFNEHFKHEFSNSI